MSPLTKVFVVLLVVLSLLLSASTITFVNAIGNQRKALDLMKQTAEADKARADKEARCSSSSFSCSV